VIGNQNHPLSFLLTFTIAGLITSIIRNFDFGGIFSAYKGGRSQNAGADTMNKNDKYRLIAAALQLLAALLRVFDQNRGWPLW
jgi:hypothetical protein